MNDGVTAADLEQALATVSVLMETVEPGGIVSKFVMMVETVDGEGRWTYLFVAPDQKPWDTLGLLAYGMALESKDSLEPGDDG